MSGPWYAGEYTSAIARAKRVLLAAGFAWSRSTGQYHPFADTKITTAGVRVTRIGCSDTIAIHVYDSNSMGEAARLARRELNARALAALRAAGLPFDDRGWLECGRTGRAAIAKAEATR